MKRLFTVLAIAAAAIATSAQAADAASAPKAMSKQNTKMADCNKDAGEKKGDSRAGVPRMSSNWRMTLATMTRGEL